MKQIYLHIGDRVKHQALRQVFTLDSDYDIEDDLLGT